MQFFVNNNINLYLVHGKEDGVVDFSGEPQKYFGIHGKIIDLTGLVLSGKCYAYLLLL